jgi:hypothetical protein
LKKVKEESQLFISGSWQMTFTKQFHHTYFLRICTCRMQGRHSFSRLFPAKGKSVDIMGTGLTEACPWTSCRSVNWHVTCSVLVCSGSSLARMLLSSDSDPASYSAGTKPGFELGSRRPWLTNCISAVNRPFGTV